MASGELLTRFDKAFTELVEIGLVQARPPGVGKGSPAPSRPAATRSPPPCTPTPTTITLVG